MSDADAAITELGIEELEPGMFVLEILTGKDTVGLSQPGLIRSAKQIADMTRKGVKTVRVDLARSQLAVAEHLVDGPSEVTIEEGGAEPGTRRTRSTPEQMDELLHEARDLQDKFVRQIKAGEAIDVEPLSEVADEMVESVFKYGDAMLCLARIRSKDAYLMEHSMNVAILLAYFAHYLELDRDVVKQLTMGGLLHDVGKVMTPDAVLHKPGRLTEEEFAIMRQHATHSRMILRATEGITDTMVDVAANHHERLDGSGYPRGLKGEQLSLYARICSIVDVYDALTADRVYRQGMPCPHAFRILLEGSGTQFDEKLVQQFIKCMGVYPPGSLVKLSNQRIAIVIRKNRQSPLKPVVKVIYHAQKKRYEPVEVLDLSDTGIEETILEGVEHNEFGIDLARFLSAG